MKHAEAKDLAHSDNCIHITHNDIMPGDLVWRHGELFEANEVFCYKNDRGRVVIRFEGKSLTSEGLSGTYGANADVKATIVKRHLTNH